MAGILYLYRLLIYHRERGGDSPQIRDLLSLMERRLYRYITRPAMFVAAFAGGGMIYLQPSMLETGWLPAKLALVVLLIASTMWAGRLVRAAADKPEALPSGKVLRFANEVPTLLMLIIVGLVIFKSF
jgi:putative membrane protein